MHRFPTWIAIALIAATALFCFVMLLPRPPAYVRYTSTPLSDGSRLTLLRPAALGNVRSLYGGKGSDPHFVFTQPETMDQQAMQWIRRRVTAIPFAPKNTVLGVGLTTIQGKSTVTKSYPIQRHKFNLRGHGSLDMVQGRLQIPDPSRNRVISVHYTAVNHGFVSDADVNLILTKTAQSIRVLQPGEAVPQP